MYKNYMFDLYGTLADIHTDEGDISLWEKTAEYYTSLGAAYTAEELQKTYCDFVDDEKNVIHNAHPEYKYIDIKIEKVFKRLYTVKGITPTDEEVLNTALFFRRTSREYIRLYSGIADLLDDLRANGGKVYLLTNAQRSFTWDELSISLTVLLSLLTRSAASLTLVSIVLCLTDISLTLRILLWLAMTPLPISRAQRA